MHDCSNQSFFVVDNILPHLQVRLTTHLYDQICANTQNILPYCFWCVALFFTLRESGCELINKSLKYSLTFGLVAEDSYIWIKWNVSKKILIVSRIFSSILSRINNILHHLCPISVFVLLHYALIYYFLYLNYKYFYKSGRTLVFSICSL